MVRRSRVRTLANVTAVTIFQIVMFVCLFVSVVTIAVVAFVKAAGSYYRW